MPDDDEVATGDALRSGHPVPGELARDSGSMSSGTSLLRGSHHGRNRSRGNGRGATRFVLRDNDDIATGDALRSGHPVRHAPGKLARNSGSMPLGTSMLRGSHFGSNRTGGSGGGGGRFALRDDDDGATGDALRSGRPVRHAPGELTRDSGSMSLGTSLLRGSHLGSNHHTGDDEGICVGAFISKPKEIGGCIDGGHDSAAGPNSSRDNDGSAQSQHRQRQHDLC